MNQLESLPDAITRFHADRTDHWHVEPTSPPADPPWAGIERNHRMNFDLWHEEDTARRDDLGPERVRQAKRAIDRFNQARNNAIEQMDTWFLEQLPAAAPEAPLHSETPGMIVDRLSILSLKLYHMRIEANRETATEQHRRLCGEKCRVLEEQLDDLRECLRRLLDECIAGTRRFKLYRQFKMYNDAALNPQLYGQEKQ